MAYAAVQLNLACTEACADPANPGCQSCLQEVWLPYTDQVLPCVQVAVIDGVAAAGQHVAAAGGTAPLGTCHGSKYKYDLERAFEEASVALNDAAIAYMAGTLAALTPPYQPAAFLAFYKGVSDANKFRVVLKKFQDAELNFGCKGLGHSGACVVEHPGEPSLRNDGLCCPTAGAPFACGGQCGAAEHCEHCAGGQVRGCDLDRQYCRRMKFRESPRDPYEYLTTCAACQPCNPNHCEVRDDTPPDAVPGTPPCAKRICHGPCDPGQTCISGTCQDSCPAGSQRVRTAAGEEECCEPKTCECEELGHACGGWVDTCGNERDCGECPNLRACCWVACSTSGFTGCGFCCPPNHYCDSINGGCIAI